MWGCPRLSVGEALDVDGAQVQPEVAANLMGERGVGAAGEDAEPAAGVLLLGEGRAEGAARVSGGLVTEGGVFRRQTGVWSSRRRGRGWARAHLVAG